MAVNTTRWDSAEYLKTEEDVLLYLEACLEEAGDDPAFIAHALDVIAQAKKRSPFESIKQGLTEAGEDMGDRCATLGIYGMTLQFNLTLPIFVFIGWTLQNTE